MEQEYARKEKAKSFDRSMLKVLMVEFMRDTNIPFIMIDNTKLRTILHFLRPDIALPCCAELLQLNVTEMATFQLWERSIKIAKGWSASDRADAVAAVNHERIKMVQKDAHIYDEQMSARAGASTLNSPSIFPSTSTIKNVKDVMKNRKQPEPQPPILEKGVKEEPFSEDYEEFAERKPTGEELLIGAQNSGHLINKVKEEEIEPPSKVPRHDNEGTTAEQNTEVSPESLAAIPTTMTGLSTYPCLVCLERVESYKVRSVTINDGFFMIYLGLKEGYYTMDTAKEAARKLEGKKDYTKVLLLLKNGSTCNESCREIALAPGVSEKERATKSSFDVCDFPIHPNTRTKTRLIHANRGSAVNSPLIDRCIYY
uniref:Uncharacterized protein n=1 Tax=Caenorhabditis japonica TaxID=281687 RepID=A0A8R1I8Q9_CAEJA